MIADTILANNRNIEKRILSVKTVTTCFLHLETISDMYAFSKFLVTMTATSVDISWWFSMICLLICFRLTNWYDCSQLAKKNASTKKIEPNCKIDFDQVDCNRVHFHKNWTEILRINKLIVSIFQKRHLFSTIASSSGCSSTTDCICERATIHPPYSLARIAIIRFTSTYLSLP